MSAKIVTRPHPFSVDRLESEAPAGTLIRDAVGDGFAFSLNGEPADPDRALADGDLLVAVAIPAGSNPKETGNKIGGWSIVAILGAIAILVFAPVAIAWLGGVLLTAGAAGVLTGVALTQGWFDLAGKSGEAAETLPGLRGARNRANPWGAVPVILGRHRLAPFYAATPYTEISGTDGETQYLNILFCVGYGPMKITQARIGESLLASNAADVRNGSITIDGVYSDVSLEIRTTGDVTLFPANVREEPVGIELKYNAPIVRMTPDKTTAIDVDIAFPVGLLQYDSEGDKQSATVQVKAEYRPAGGSWSDFPGSWSGTGFNVTKTKNRTMRFKMSKTGLTAGKYEVRVTRLTADATDSKVVDRVQILAVRSWFADLPLAAAIRDKTVRIGLRIKATDQLQGVVDQFSVLAESVLPDYDGTGSGVSEWPAAVTANPASCALALLRGPASPNPVGDSLINWAAFEAFHAWCDTKDFECSAVISDQASLGELLTRVLMTGRAALDIYGGQYSVSFDGPKTSPVQQFTPRNSAEFSGTKNMEEAPHALRVGYLSEEADYTAEELIVYRDGYTDVTATKFEDVSLWGVTRHDQAYKAARYMLACRLLRPELWQIKVDAEYLVCRRGDLVRFSHDVLLVGIAAGRIKALTTGTGTITGFSSDEVLPMETGKSYAVRIRRADSAPLYVPVNTVVGDQTSVVFTTPIADTSGVAAGDLFSFGEAGSETIEALVAAIEPGEDLSATLTLVDYAPDVQTADSGTIPAYDPHVTLPPAAILLNAMTQVQAAETGTLISERPPEGVSPTYSEVEGMVGGGSVPPDNNVTSVAFSSSQNADGSIHIEFSAAYSQGTNKADGVFIYYKAALSAPGAFDLALDKAEWKQIALTDTSVGHGFDVPARTGGTGGAPIHYRFGAVAGMGSKLHTAGVVTPTGWDDKVFDASLQFDQYNYWDLVTGELRAGTIDSFLKVKPSTGEIEIDNADMRLREAELYTFKGTGAARKSLAHEELALVWYDDPVGGTKKEIGRMEFDANWNRVVFRGNIQNAKDRIKSALFSLLLMQPAPFSMSAGSGIVQILNTFMMYDYLAVTNNGTVYKRKGKLWESLYSADYVSRVNGMCYSQIYGVFIFLTNSLLLRMDHGGRGNFWIEDNTPFGNTDVSKNAINQVDTLNTIAIAKVANSYTRNYGAGWTTSATIGTTAIAFSAGGNASSAYVLIVAGTSGYCATKVGAGVWTARTSQFGTTQINVAKGTSGGSGYILLLGNDGKISKSTDGSTFVLQTSGLTTGDHIIDALYDINNGLWWACTSNNKIIKGNSLGTIWTLQTGVPTLPAGVSMRSIAIDYSNEVIIGCDGGIIINTINGGITWAIAYLSPFNFGAVFGPTYHAPNQSFYFCGNGSTVVVKSANPETSFAQVTSPPGNIRKLLSGNGILVGVPDLTATIYYSTNDGVSWAAASSPPSIAVTGNWSASMFDGAYFFLTNKYEVWRSADGNTWTQVRADTGDHTASECGILAAGSRILLYGPTHVFKSTDHGGSWQELAVPPTRLTNHYGYVGWHSDVRKESVFVIYEKAYIIADASDAYSLLFERYDSPIAPVFELFGFWFVYGRLVNGYNDYEIVQRGNSVISPSSATFIPFEFNGKTYAANLGHIGLLDY